MTAQILDGKATAAAIKRELTQRVDKLRARGVVPGLGTVLVGDDPASKTYVAGKHRDCAELGIASVRRDLPATASKDEVLAAVGRVATALNATREVTLPEVHRARAAAQVITACEAGNDPICVEEARKFR